MTLMVTTLSCETICLCVSFETAGWLLCVDCFHLQTRTTVGKAVSASWIGVTQVFTSWYHSAKRVESAVVCFKVLAAVWTQCGFHDRNPGGWHATCTCLNRSEWRSSAKLRLQEIKPGYLCERTGRCQWSPLAPPPSAEWQSVGDLPLAGSVSGLVEQDVSWLRVLGNVRCQTVELLDRLCINFLQKKKKVPH